MKIVWTGEIFEPARATLSVCGLEVSQFGLRDLVDEDRFIAALSGCGVYVNGGFEAASERVILSAPDLRLIIYLGADAASYIDLPTAKSRDIIVCNTPGANAKSVAEIAIGLAISAARRIPSSIVSSETDRWQPATVSALHGMKIGLLGMGHIAEAFAKFLRLGLDADVSYWSRTRKPDIEQALGIRFQTRADLIASSDLISLHLPQNSGVVLGRAEFKAMKAGAILINTARPHLVDAEALLWALTSDRLAHAAFDGFYGDGARPVSPVERKILNLGPDRFVATAHVGWRTYEADIQAQHFGLRAIEEFINGQEVSNRVA
jgi:glyoxylate reductase